MKNNIINESLDIVYYLEPWVEVDQPFMKSINLEKQLYPHFKVLVDLGYKITVICSEFTHTQILRKKVDIVELVDFRTIRYKELIDNFGTNSYKVIEDTFLNTLSSEFEKRFKELLSYKLRDINPIAIISFLSPLPNISDILPNTRIYYQEYGIFSRNPFEATYYFDDRGMFQNSYLNSESFKNIEPISYAGMRSLYDLRDDYRARLKSIDSYKNLDNYAKSKYNNFSKVLLLPLQFSNYFGFNATSDYSSQFDFLINVLEKIPSSVGVIVTEHLTWPKIITPAKREFLEKQYPNFIFNEKINKMQSASSILTLLVDGVVSVSSSIALQALFWNKIVIAAGNSHINGISDFHIDDYQTNDCFYCLSKGKSSDDKLIHLLKYYYVPDSILTNTHTAEIFYKNLFTKSIGGFVVSEEKDIAYNYSVRKLPETKEVIEFNQGTYANYLSSDIIDKVASNEVISFDIFDTLIIRPFSFPHHVFTYMNDEVAEITGDYDEKFSIYRRSLHQEVKKITALEEVRLDEIYDYIAEVKGWSVKVKNEVKALELNNELHFCTEKKYGKAVFELARKLNKKIILISDMYLSKEHIEAILSKNGYSEYDGLYVSSEYRKAKHTSNLFKVVLSEHEVHPSKILHVGDNKISDVDIPNKLGLNTLFIDKNITHFVRNASNQALWKYDIHRTSFSYKEAEYHLPALLGLYANKLSDNESLIKTHSLFNGSSYNIGYYGLGLLVFQFNKWLIDQAKENGIKTLYFLSRDAHIFYQVFCRMAKQFPEYTSGIDFKYIYVSRKTIITANIFTEQDILDLISRPYRFKLTLRAFLKNRFNLSEDFMLEIASMDLKDFGFDDLDTEFLLKNNSEELKDFAIHIKDIIFENSTLLREKAKAYLNQEGVRASPDEAVVDLGYSGSIQKSINGMFKGDLGGLYLITTTQSMSIKDKGWLVKGFLAENIDQYNKSDNYKHFFFGYTMLYEALFTSNESSLEEYIFVEELKKYVPSSQLYDKTDDVLLDSVHNGIKDFSTDLMQFFGSRFMKDSFPVNRTISVFEHFLKSPTVADALVFQNYHLSDTNNGYDHISIIPDISESFTEDSRKRLLQSSYWKEGAHKLLASRVAPKNINVSANKEVNTKIIRKTNEVSSEPKNVSLSKLSSIINLQEIASLPSDVPLKKSDIPLIKSDVTLRRINKLRRDPYLFFDDANKGISWAKVFFKKNK
ncbi:HAD family hydrolase [Psychrobacter sp. AOP5-CZ1-12]|uniref:HAD family hydrolase n=1 Tax=Psychrobacter sp. AOP5-CZ1-12 TaxID=3457651 RepID=UPI00402B66CD